jgi:branched-chain amino acid transport system permease protein
MTGSMLNARTLAIAIAVALLAALPFWMGGIYYINVASQILFYAVFALGLNVLVGYAGLTSLGHAALFGVASYATAYMLQLGYGHTESILVALVVGVASMAVYAVLSLRSTGIGFIMITLALGEILWGLAYRWISLTGGDNGINVPKRPAPFGFSMTSPTTFYYVTFTVFILSVIAMAIFVNSPFGAAGRACRAA